MRYFCIFFILLFDTEITRVLDILDNRGPDDHGHSHFSAPTELVIDLIHTRLSITDESSLGHQPMSDITGNYSIIFNGEIYNFQSIRDQLCYEGISFRSTSDTVILELYKHLGTDCFSKFNGIFSIVIYDKLRNAVIVARDTRCQASIFIS